VDAQRVNPPPAQSVEQAQAGSTAKEILTDAAIIALVIAASVAAYKAMGKPCACAEDRMSNGPSCGNNSAWVRAGSYKPLCRSTDVTPELIVAYRSKKAVPGVK
jgi:hypothetical protein